jgi:hypothetical protein
MASRTSKPPADAADDVVVIDDGPAAGHPAAATAPPQAGASGRWNEIQAMFVDDPRRSVELAAGMADKAIEDLVASFRQREAALTSAWQGGDAGTEALRNALKDYRAFCGAMQEISASGLTAAARAQRRQPAADA